MATETLGSCGQLGLDFKKEIGSRQTKITGDKSQTSWLFQNISVKESKEEMPYQLWVPYLIKESNTKFFICN